MENLSRTGKLVIKELDHMIFKAEGKGFY